MFVTSQSKSKRVTHTRYGGLFQMGVYGNAALLHALLWRADCKPYTRLLACYLGLSMRWVVLGWDINCGSNGVRWALMFKGVNRWDGVGEVSIHFALTLNTLAWCWRFPHPIYSNQYSLPLLKQRASQLFYLLEKEPALAVTRTRNSPRSS